MGTENESKIEVEDQKKVFFLFLNQNRISLVNSAIGALSNFS